MRDAGKTQPASQGAFKGRGAASRIAGRFEKTVAHAESDGWGPARHEADEGAEAPGLPRLDTEVREERARSIISRNGAPTRAASARPATASAPSRR